MSNGKATVLLIEDNEDHAFLIEKSFEDHGFFTVSTVKSIKSSEKFLENENPSLIICDLNLPDGDGIDYIIKRNLAERFPIIIITAFGSEKRTVKAMRAGVLDYVVKSEKTFNEIPVKSERVLREWRTREELKQAEEQLLQAQKMETVGNLAGGLAHDFNNLLGGITGTVSLINFLFESNSDPDMETIKRHIKVIENAALRASDMVQQLLTLSRRHELALSPVDLNLSIKHTVKICSNTFDKSIAIKPLYHNEPAIVEADPTQVEQILLNLCVNASHAMTNMKAAEEQQGGELVISVEPVKATKRFCSVHPEAQPGNYWLVKVKDSGIGIASENISKIFDPFFTTKGKKKGTGLGLAMVYSITKQHKGFITVNSQIGIGTTMNLFLPALEVEEQVEVIEAEEEVLPMGEGTVLVVDDEELMRQTAKAILQECGYTVILAKDGKEAVQIFEQQHDRISVTLLDMAMPKMSGKEAFIEMKKIDPETKVILTSGFKEDSRIDEIMKMGIKDFIQKPYSMALLAEKMSILTKNNSVPHQATDLP